MSSAKLAKIGAIFFIFWGLLHVAGGIAVFSSGFAAYGDSGGEYPVLAHAILRYFAYLIACVGCWAALIGAFMNWRNKHLGLAINTALVSTTDLGLIMFLVLPGFVSWLEASIGLGLFVMAVAPATMACRAALAAPARV